MNRVSVIGYPRIGERRELKKVTEGYLNGIYSKEELLKEAEIIKRKNWEVQSDNQVNFISSNDFSFYDILLDTAFTLNVIPDRYRELGIDDIDTYFAMAKGHQKNGKDVRALEMKKWFNTNYHYIVPEIYEETEFKLNSSKVYDEYSEAKKIGIKTKPIIIGPFTFLKLSKIKTGRDYSDYINSITDVYVEIITRLNKIGVEYLQIDEPILAMDLNDNDIANFKKIYLKVLPKKRDIKIILQTYFGDTRDIYSDIIKLDFDAIGLDFIEGEKNEELIQKNGFPDDKLLFAGIINGKNVWKNDYKKSLELIRRLSGYLPEDNIVLSTSCSLLHVPYTLRHEINMETKYKEQLAFAEEKLRELAELKELLNEYAYEKSDLYIENQKVLKKKENSKEFFFVEIRNEVDKVVNKDFKRSDSFRERIRKQRESLKIPKLPTTTIGSFPQTKEIRKIRSEYKRGEISREEYEEMIKRKIVDVIKLQEDIGLDVLVHGEFERNDMVEYFGENFTGYIFTKNGWVQSYGTRGVKPPIIFGDIRRDRTITVEWIKYAQSLTNKPVKGVLTGPVTMLNWSFPREDLSLDRIVFQLALAIKAEVMDLEKADIKIIQIDEAALREKLPLRKLDWYNKYLKWGIKSFLLVTSSVKAETQIHTHMCYSEFSDIIDQITRMDADVITIESAKSDLAMLKVLKESNYDKDVGPGVYDIHSPRIPSKDELEANIKKMIEILDVDRLWINPDCGLKTRKEEETRASLKNMVDAAKEIRKMIRNSS